jgi:crossover junction endodeoxyribonuclease RuvC
MILIGTDCGVINNSYCVIDTTTLTILEVGDVVSKHKLLQDKLLNIDNKYGELFNKYKPEVFVYEEPCFIGRGVNGTNISQALGVIKLNAAKVGATIISYSATHIKKQVTGDGKADKELVASNAANYFKVDKSIFLSDHSSDSAAIGMCYLIEQGVTNHG